MVSTEPTKSQRQERRQHTRTKVAVEAELNLEGGRTPLRVKTADLSLGGLYVEMMFTLEIGSKLKIVLWMAGAQVSTVLRGDPLSPPKLNVGVVSADGNGDDSDGESAILIFIKYL